jgi:hypothetical protein
MPTFLDRLRGAARRFARACGLRLQQPAPAPDEERQPRAKHSLVLCLREPLALDSALIEAVATRAYARSFAGKGGGNFIIGQGVNHVLHVEEMWFLVLHMARPFAPPPALREMPAHGAWLSIDLMAAAPEFPVAKIDDYLGRFLAELPAFGAKVVAIFHPETGRVAPWAPEHRAQLAAGDPLSVFDAPGVG